VWVYIALAVGVLVLVNVLLVLWLAVRNSPDSDAWRPRE